MATYYVRKTGSDLNNGTSPATAWQTIGKALGSSGIASGDNLYIGAGVYRETVTVNISSVLASTKVYGDVDGSQTGDAGEVRWTAYTTNDKTSPSSTVLLNLNGKGYLNFKGITFVGGSGGIIYNGGTGVCTETSFTECAFIAMGGTNQYAIRITTTDTDTALNWTIHKCHFLYVGDSYDCIRVEIAQGMIDLDCNLIIRNNTFFGGTSMGYVVNNQPQLGGSGGSGAVGGIDFQNNTVIGFSGCFNTGFNSSTTNPCVVYNNFIVCGGTALNSSTSGGITENYNLIFAPTPRSNVSAGANSKSNSSYAPLIHMGQELHQGKLLRPWGMPTSDSPLLGWGSAGASLDEDALGRLRPSGSGVVQSSTSKAVGAYERHDFAVKESTTVDSGTSIKMAGPGDHQLLIPVNATSTTISIKVRRDGNYGAGTRPQIRLLANGEIGVSQQIVTDSGSANAWNTLTLGAFTPSAAGWVTLRLESYSAATGNVYWDTLTVTG